MRPDVNDDHSLGLGCLWKKPTLRVAWRAELHSGPVLWGQPLEYHDGHAEGKNQHLAHSFVGISMTHCNVQSYLTCTRWGLKAWLLGRVDGRYGLLWSEGELPVTSQDLDSYGE